MKKKTQLLLACIAVLGIGLIIINACSKTVNESSLKIEKNYQLKEFIPDYENIIPLINQFNSKYKEYKLGYKSGEELPLDEALWTLEAGVNYEFRSPKDSLVIITYESASFTFNITENKTGEIIVDNDDLYLNYELILLATEEAISTNGSTSKLVFTDLAVDSINESEAEIVMTAGVGQPRPRKCFIQSDDYWYAANELGYCTGGQAQTGILDAADRIDELIDNRHCSEPTCPIEYYVSITEKSFYWNSTTDDWYFWNGDYSSDDECLDPDDISYWWDYAEALIEDERPTGKSFMDVVFKDEFSLASSEWIHCIDPVRYGVPDCGGSGE